MKPLLLAVALFLFAPALWAAPKKPVLSGNEGLAVFRMDSNYPNIIGNKLRVNFKEKDSLTLLSVAPRRKGDLTFHPMPAGEYRMLSFTTLQYDHTLPKDLLFEIKPGEATYLGDILFSVSLGYGRNWKIKELGISDQAERAQEESAQAFDGAWTSRPLVLQEQETAVAEGAGEAPIKLKNAGKKLSPDDLQQNGLIVVRLAVKRSNALLTSLTLGLKASAVSDFRLGISNARSRVGELNSGDIFSMKKSKLDEHSRGVLLVMLAPPGDYRVTDFHTSFEDSSTVYSVVETDLPFEVKAGEVTYLGEVFANGLNKRTLGLSVPDSVEFYINDYQERDAAALGEMYPFLKDRPISTTLLQGTEGWEAVFKAGFEFRDTLED